MLTPITTVTLFYNYEFKSQVSIININISYQFPPLFVVFDIPLSHSLKRLKLIFVPLYRNTTYLFRQTKIIDKSFLNRFNLTKGTKKKLPNLSQEKQTCFANKKRK
jgi:hypothetical protein